MVSRKKEPPKNPVLPHHLEQADAYIRKWQKLLGLTDWRCQRSRRKPSGGAAAEVVIHHPDRLAELRFSSDFGAENVDESMESTVVHELMHIVLCELKNHLEYNIVGEQLDSAEHRVVNMMTDLLIRHNQPGTE